jgi:outer membrane receptor protein involved in Fe transport
LRASAAADNLFNKDYELTLGGVNFDDFMASMWMCQIKPLTGRGRSVYANLIARF